MTPNRPRHIAGTLFVRVVADCVESITVMVDILTLIYLHATCRKVAIYLDTGSLRDMLETERCRLRLQLTDTRVP